MSIDWSKTIAVADKQREQAEATYQAWKAARQQSVNGITVKVGGMVFDGDELSQNRMARAVAAADFPEQTVAWTLADNTIAVVTVAQLKQALYLAGTRQTELWSEGRHDILAA
ncbi:DUF4376 domain-containing protein [Aeromonas salmonicida]|uniref:DUF4376 domain-containing protein n=1 Tax=Aeromonas salmonicida TaxID=645 RepID=UPI0035A572ED